MSIGIRETPTDFDDARIIERPNGFYWQDADGGREVGPFATLQEALSDMEFAEGNLEVGEGLAEAESEIGIADWLDPDTGEPAEDPIPRLEDH